MLRAAGSSSSSRSNRSSRPSEMGSLNNLNVLNDLNVWNIPERKACLRGEYFLSSGSIWAGTHKESIARAPPGSSLIHPFDDRGDALADTDAHGGEAEAAAAFFHFVNKRRHDPGAAAAQRVAEGDGAAVDVELVEIDA